MFCHFCSVTKPCPTLWDPVNCSLPGSSVHGILQTRILKWVAIPFSTTQCEYYFKCQINTALYAHLLPLKISFRLKFCSATGLGALLHVCLWTSDPDLSLLLTVALTGPSSHSLLLPELSLSLIVSQSAPVSLNIFISVSLCVLVWFFLRLCLGPCCSFSISLLSSPLACSVLTYLHCSISVSHFWSLHPFSHCVSHSLSAPIPLSSDFPCPLLSSQSCFLREAQFLSLRLFLIVSTALLVTSSLSFSVFLLVFLLFHSPTFSRNQMSLLGKSSFQSKGFRVLIKPSC